MSDIILDCTVFGSPDWFNWVQDEEETISQIKAAYVTVIIHFSSGSPIFIFCCATAHSYDVGINAFNTANA